jgi:hypothetical protein
MADVGVGVGVDKRVNENEVQELLVYAKSIADKYIKLADDEIKEFDNTINDSNASENLKEVAKEKKQQALEARAKWVYEKNQGIDSNVAFIKHIIAMVDVAHENNVNLKGLKLLAGEEKVPSFNL